MSEMDADALDTRGLRCPLPVLKLRKRLQALPDGATVTMIADDPAALIDVPHFCSEQGHRLADQRDGAAEADAAPSFLFTVVKGG